MNKQILELYKHPQNFGIIENPTYQNTEAISSCGDELTIQILVKNNTIKDAKFQGSGCIISIVSASLLADKIKGMKIDHVKKMTKQDMLSLFNANISPSRIKCAVLSLNAVKNSLK